MRVVTFALIAVALIAAGGVALLVGQQVDSTKPPNGSGQTEAMAKPKLVLVAANDLPAGKKLSRSDLDWLTWPEEALRTDYISAETEDQDLEREFLGSTVRRGMPAGVPLTRKSVFKRDQPGFLAGALRPGMRAVAVEVTAASGAAGFILPGDEVDVVLTHDIRKDFSRRGGDTPIISGRVIRYTAETILHKIRVVAVDQKIDDFDSEAAVVKTVTLEVSPKQAEVLIVAKAMGDLSLTLRSLDASAAVPDDQSTTTDLDISRTLMNTFGKATLVSRSAPKEPPSDDQDTPSDAAPPATSANLRAGDLSAALAPGTRAYSVEVNAVSGAAGFIRPGDHVDVILTHDIRKNAPASGGDNPVIGESVIQFTAETILHDLKVVAVDQRSADLSQDVTVAGTVTLQVFPEQAEVLAVGEAMGDLSLSLRSKTAAAPRKPVRAFTSDLRVSPTLNATYGARDRELEKITEAKETQVVIRQPVDGAEPTERPAPEKGRLADSLARGTRAVSVEVTAVSGAAGFIQPGDHVDVILTHDISKNAPRDGDGKDKSLIADRVIRFTAETILRDIPVIAVDQKTADEKGAPAVAQTVTLQVIPRQAQVLAVAAEMGKISLSLRSPGPDAPGDRAPDFTGDVQVSQALSAALAGAAQARADDSQGKKDADAIRPHRHSRARARVKVYRGGQATTQELTAR